jgi:hypothetical protein
MGEKIDYLLSNFPHGPEVIAEEKPKFDIALLKPSFTTRHHAYWYKKLLGTIASISPEIRISTSSDPLISALNGGNNIPYTSDFDSKLSELADDYLSDRINW